MVVYTVPKILIKEMRDNRPDLPVICISGYTQESVVREVESIENVNFLAKPFSLRQLAGKVKEVLEERTPAG